MWMLNKWNKKLQANEQKQKEKQYLIRFLLCGSDFARDWKFPEIILSLFILTFSYL